MNCYDGKDLARSFRTVRKNTLTIAEEIPAKKYSFRATPESRSVGELLAHIANGHRFYYQVNALENRSSMEGFDFLRFFEQSMAEEKKPRTKDEILTLLRVNGELWAGWLEGLSDDYLAERVQLPAGAEPPSKSRFEMLLSVKEHEMHHRGQLMLIERMIGITPHLTRERQARFATAQSATART